MCFLSRTIKHAFAVTIQRPHYSDPRKHRWPPVPSNEKQRLHRGLPLFSIVFHLGQFRDVERGVAECCQW